MLIELFTDGRVLIDGQDQGRDERPEKLLHDYLLDPRNLIRRRQDKRKIA
jgi:hypothetical protein